MREMGPLVELPQEHGRSQSVELRVARHDGGEHPLHETEFARVVGANSSVSVFADTAAKFAPSWLGTHRLPRSSLHFSR